MWVGPGELDSRAVEKEASDSLSIESVEKLHFLVDVSDTEMDGMTLVWPLTSIPALTVCPMPLCVFSGEFH